MGSLDSNARFFVAVLAVVAAATSVLGHLGVDESLNKLEVFDK